VVLSNEGIPLVNRASLGSVKRRVTCRSLAQSENVFSAVEQL